MSVTHLPAASVASLVADARAAVASGQSVPAARLSTDEIAAAVEELAALESQVAAWRLELTAEADARRVAEATADTGTDAWAAALTGDTRASQAAGLRLARRLRETYHVTREAFAAGRLRREQVRVIVRAADQAPPEATPEQVALAEEWLVAKATGDGNRGGRPMNATRLRQAARRMVGVVSWELAAKHEQILLGRERQRAEVETYLVLGDNGDGTWSGKFTIPELHGQLLAHALERLTAPRRLNRVEGRLVVDESAPGTDNGCNYWESRGAAFCELLEHLPSDGYAANGVELIVTVALDALRSSLGAAETETGVAISAAEARRLACNAAVIPAVLGGDSVPLNLGRTRRLHTKHQRRALSLVHRTCAVETCERPFAWCEIHHPDPWSAGGHTDLGNALPLCGHHHRKAHDSRWRLGRHSAGGWQLSPVRRR